MNRLLFIVFGLLKFIFLKSQKVSMKYFSTIIIISFCLLLGLPLTYTMAEASTSGWFSILARHQYCPDVSWEIVTVRFVDLPILCYKKYTISNNIHIPKERLNNDLQYATLDNIFTFLITDNATCVTGLEKAILGREMKPIIFENELCWATNNISYFYSTTWRYQSRWRGLRLAIFLEKSM